MKNLKASIIGCLLLACFYSCEKPDSNEEYEKLIPNINTEEEEIPTKEDTTAASTELEEIPRKESASTTATEEEEIPTKEE